MVELKVIEFDNSTTLSANTILDNAKSKDWHKMIVVGFEKNEELTVFSTHAGMYNLQHIVTELQNYINYLNEKGYWENEG